MELRGKVLATNRWMPNRLYIYEDRVEEVVPARSLVTASLGKHQACAPSFLLMPFTTIV